MTLGISSSNNPGPGSSNTVNTVANGVDVQVFSASGAFTWNKPGGNPTVTRIMGCGGGGGAGGGGTVAIGTFMSGGGAGGGASWFDITIPTALLANIETVTIGAGGISGAGSSSSGVQAGNGGQGSNTTFGSWVTGFGGGGGAGTTAGGNGGVGGNGFIAVITSY